MDVTNTKHTKKLEQTRHTTSQTGQANGVRRQSELNHTQFGSCEWVQGHWPTSLRPWQKGVKIYVWVQGQWYSAFVPKLKLGNPSTEHRLCAHIVRILWWLGQP